MNIFKERIGQIEEAINKLDLPAKPAGLYDSINYILRLGGKRLRPLLVLESASLFGSSSADVMKTALVVELFHNFSLMHDDIMDDADLRRGKPTVHTKWNTPTAILGGDALLVLTYQLINELPALLRAEILQTYNKTAIEVCEGQQMDMNFEEHDSVLISDYLEMIRLKTAVLMGASCKLGALVAGGDKQAQDKLYSFGESLGIAFQLKDDYLDCFGSEDFGKKKGGDIIEGKKTYLYLKSLELLDSGGKAGLVDAMELDDDKEKVTVVKGIFEDSGAKAASSELMEEYFSKAKEALGRVSVPENQKASLYQLAEEIWKRIV